MKCDVFFKFSWSKADDGGLQISEKILPWIPLQTARDESQGNSIVGDKDTGNNITGHRDNGNNYGKNIKGRGNERTEVPPASTLQSTPSNPTSIITNTNTQWSGSHLSILKSSSWNREYAPGCSTLRANINRLIYHWMKFRLWKEVASTRRR